MSDIFHEIEEELRRENLERLWARYGKYVLVLAVLIVLAAVVGWRWREYRLHQSQNEGARYAVALDLARQGKDKEAADAFTALAQQAASGRAILARLEEGTLKARAGDTAGALAAYDALAKDGSVDSIYRNAATLLAAQLSLKEGDPKAVIGRLAPLTGASNPWHPTALELTALAQLKAGDKAAARATYQRLADDLTAPQNMRARAAEIVAALAD